MNRILIISLAVFMIVFCFNGLPIKAKSDITCLCFKENSNCYLYGRNGTAIIVDAGADAESILYYAAKEGLKIRTVILTHGHADHTSHVEELRDKTRAKVIIHKNDLDLLRQDHPGVKVDGILNGGEVLDEGGLRLRIIHTPGHTPGSVCIQEGNVVFTGDTLFRETIGRTDYEKSSAKEMAESLRKLMNLRDDLTVCPGHGDTTTIGSERVNNRFLRDL